MIGSVAGVSDPVAILVLLPGFASSGSCRPGRPARAVVVFVTGVAQQVAVRKLGIGVFLKRVGDVRAVVGACRAARFLRIGQLAHQVVVGVRVAGIAQAIAVEVFLPGVCVRRAVVAGIAQQPPSSSSCPSLNCTCCQAASRSPSLSSSGSQRSPRCRVRRANEVRVVGAV
jgi:hypothetical protein